MSSLERFVAGSARAAAARDRRSARGSARASKHGGRLAAAADSPWGGGVPIAAAGGAPAGLAVDAVIVRIASRTQQARAHTHRRITRNLMKDSFVMR